MKEQRDTDGERLGSDLDKSKVSHSWTFLSSSRESRMPLGRETVKEMTE